MHFTPRRTARGLLWLWSGVDLGRRTLAKPLRSHSEIGQSRPAHARNALSLAAAVILAKSSYSMQPCQQVFYRKLTHSLNLHLADLADKAIAYPHQPEAWAAERMAQTGHGLNLAEAQVQTRRDMHAYVTLH